MSKVLVTGANGFLGSWLVKDLLQQGHQVKALVRKKSRLDDLQSLPCEFVYGDVTDLESLYKAFENVEAVFHLAGLIAYKKADRAKMESVNVNGTQNVIEACIHCHVPRLIHISSVVAVGAGFSKTQILSENSTYNVSHLNLGYFETKRKAELLVLEAVQKRNLDAVILNPSTIYGPGDSKKGSRKTQLSVAKGTFPFYTNGGVSVVHVQDVVTAILAAWKIGQKGERYILSGENLLIKDLFHLIAEEAQVTAPRFLLPNFVLQILGIWGDLISVLGFKSSLSRENAWTATLFHWFDSSKAKKDLGFNPRPAQEAIKESVQWSIKNGLLKK